MPIPKLYRQPKFVLLLLVLLFGVLVAGCWYGYQKQLKNLEKQLYDLQHKMQTQRPMNSKLFLFILLLCSFSLGLWAQVTPQGSLSGNEICPGAQATLAFTASAGVGPFTVRYTDGNAIRTQTGVRSGAPFNAKSNTTATKTYTLLKVTGADGGTRSSGFTDATGTVTVSTRPDLQGLALAPITSVCAGADASLSLSGFVQTHSFQSKPPISTSADFPTSAYATDLDGDGDLDVLSLSYVDQKIAWYKNDGFGRFGEEAIISTIENPLGLHAADLDGDGDMDVLSTSVRGGVYWFRNDGSGNFTSQPEIATTPGWNHSVYAADLDGDGYMDVLLASGAEDKIMWYKNDGSGGFSAQTPISTSADFATSVYAADLDGDGDLDVLSASENDDKIAWYKNDGSGQFTGQTAISTSADGAVSVYAADLDGDGDLDVLSASDNDNKIAWYKNDGSGNFGSQTVISNALDTPTAVYAADLDGDGDMDVLSASFLGSMNLVWYKNDGSGGFAVQAVIQSFNGGYGASSVHAADLDGDGDLDVLSAIAQFDKIAWYENRTPFSGNASVTYTVGGGVPKTAIASVSAGSATVTLTAPKAGLLTLLKISNGGSCAVSTGKTTQLRHLPRPDLKDLTLDPIAPVCAGSNASLPLSGFVKDHSFQTRPSITTSANRAFSVYTADLDGDGDSDVLSASVGDDKIAWYKNDGSGNFTAQPPISTSADGAYSVHAADLDGDGDLDVLSASNLDDKIAWYKNDGSGNFTAQPPITTSANRAASVYAADLDGDGDLDVLSASILDDKIAWYRNDGSGNFTPQSPISTSTDEPWSVYAADLDGDGDTDVLSMSYAESKVVWYKNDGNGNFTLQPSITTSAFRIWSVYAADLDGDGDVDVLSASTGDNKIAWYKNDGSGNFTTQPFISTAAYNARSVYAADLDGDGDLDVLSASFDDNKITWYKNDGNGNFIPQTAISYAANGTNSVYAADLDGDGDMDVLSACYNDNKIAWYENRMPFSGNAQVSYTINGGSTQTAPITVSSGSALAVIASPVSGTLQLSKISAANGCETPATNSAPLSVDPVSVGGTVSSVQSICTGTSPADLTLSGQVGNVVRWEKSANPTFSSPVSISSTSAILTSALIGNLTTHTYFRAVVKSGVCNEATSSSVLITVNLLPTATISGTTTVCKNSPLPNITFTGANATAPYTFTYKINDGPAQTVTTTSGSSVTVAAPTGTDGAFVYSLVSVSESSSTACSQTQTGSATVTVNPLPTATISGTTTICKNNTSPNITFTGANATAPYTFTYKINDGSAQTVTTTSGNSVTVAAPTGTDGAFVYSLVSVSESSSTACSQTQTGSATVTVNPLPTATISGTTTICKNNTSPNITFTGANATAPYTFTYKINDGSLQTVTTTSGSSVTVAAPTGTDGAFVYSLVSVSESSLTACSQAQSGSVEVKVQGKPTITLTTLQQTLNEGNSQTFCDTDANPVNSLQFNVTGSCVVGSPVWRVQVGSGAWGGWSTNPPVSQLSNNQPHRYQAACDANCPVTYTSPIELTINYRSTVPQNVSMLVDGVTVAVGETKEVCSLVNMPLTFTTNCGAHEVVIYSVDGGEYSAGVPVGLVDNQYHNYRVRCRKSDGTPSCVESESGVMRLKLVTIPSAPTVSLSSTSSCNPSASFSGQSTCGSLRTVWYNATTNIALPSLPSTVPSQTTSYYARCQTENGCLSEKSNVVTFTLTPTQVAPVITASQEIVCTGTRIVHQAVKRFGILASLRQVLRCHLAT